MIESAIILAFFSGLTFGLAVHYYWEMKKLFVDEEAKQQ